MNQLDTKLPTIDERACTYAVLEYEINQILKEFDCPTDINDTDEKTVGYIYKKLNIVHNQIKILKSKYKDAERRAFVYKEEIDHLDRKIDATSSLDSEWDESEKHDSDEEVFNIDRNIDFSRNLITDYEPVERKSQLFKQSIPDSPTNNIKHLPGQDEILDMLGLNPPTNKTKNGNFSFYPMAFLYSNNLIANKYFKHLTPPFQNTTTQPANP